MGGHIAILCQLTGLRKTGVYANPASACSQRAVNNNRHLVFAWFLIDHDKAVYHIPSAPCSSSCGGLTLLETPTEHRYLTSSEQHLMVMA